jgi:hypothetical protein
MKLLRNPVVVGILAVVAVGMVIYQVFLPIWRRSHPAGVRRAAAPKPATASAPAAARAALTAEAPAARVSSPSAGKPAIGAAPGIEMEYVRTNFPRWLEAPQRDPFLLASPIVSNESTNEPPSPVSAWKLKGIWRQTGSRVAAINNGIFSEGDEIEGYQIITIEADGVWFQSTNRMERLSLRPKQAVAPKVPVPGKKKTASPKKTG